MSMVERYGKKASSVYTAAYNMPNGKEPGVYSKVIKGYSDQVDREMNAFFARMERYYGDRFVLINTNAVETFTGIVMYITYRILPRK